ncbi:glycosyltransferase [Microbacterium sp. HA-8]|uniref:glycosyltransferase n=1 Tax=Microbacterium sp. HA-8 TaxID=3234200 RepID=UPI0038F5FB0F
MTAMVNNASGTAYSGHSTSIVATTTPGEDLTFVGERAPGVELHLLPRTFPGVYGYSRPLSAWLRASLSNFDLVVIHEVFSYPAIEAARMAAALGVPYVVRPHGSLDPYDLRKHGKTKRLLSPLFRKMLSRSNGIWLTAEMEADRVDTFGAKPSKAVTPLAVPRVDPVGSRSRFRATYGFADDDLVFLFLGRLDAKKGIERIMNAFAHATFHRRAFLVLAGSGEAEFERVIDERLRSLPRNEAVIRTGFLIGAERSDAFAGSDVFLLHSDNENFGLAPVEALHHSLPSILSDEVYISADLHREGVAFVVAVDDVEALGDLMGTLSDSAGAAALAEAGARSAAAAALYDPERVARLDDDVLASLLKGSAT